MKKLKKSISLVLVLALVIGILPSTFVLASDPEAMAMDMDILSAIAPTSSDLDFKTMKLSGERSNLQFGRVEFFDRTIMQSIPFDPMLEGAKIEFSVDQTQTMGNVLQYNQTS
jgi:hypothetical protein